MYEPLLEDVVSHRFKAEHGFWMQKGHLKNIHYSNAAGGKPRTYAIRSHHLTSRWSRLFTEHCSPRIASYLEGWGDMPQGISEYITGLTNSHTYKNGRVFSAIALQKSIKTAHNVVSWALFFCQNYWASENFFNITVFTQLNLPMTSLWRVYNPSFPEMKTPRKEDRNPGVEHLCH